MVVGDWVDELDARAASDALVASLAKVLEAEAEQVVLAAHWADLHAPADVSAPTSPFEEGVRRTGAEGTPEVIEFAGAELAALLGLSTHAGEQRIADAMNLRHRHPLLWDRLRAGAVRVWLATKVARRCAATHLTQEQAFWVDAQTTPYIGSLPPGRFLALVEAKIAAADPEAAAARAEQQALERFVRCGQTDEHGLKTLVARARAGDVLYVVAVLDRIAGILASQGDPDSLEVRRAKALRVLANPARALALLLDADGSAATPAPDSAPPEGLFLTGADGLREPAERLSGDWAEPDPQEPDDPVTGPDPASLQEALASFDASTLDPAIVFHVHLDRAALSDDGVARVEGLGPIVLGELRAWLGESCADARFTVRPVVDLAEAVRVDRYEIPDSLRRAVVLRDPYESFPYGTLPARSGDLDHVIPWRDDGSPGQTRLDNLAPLSRRHHRMKTVGRWQVRQPKPGEYWWRTPQGHWLRVDAAGTHYMGRGLDPLIRVLDASWGNIPVPLDG